MGTITTGICIIGMLVGVVGEIMLLVAAFKQSVWWGLGCIFIPFVVFIFIALYWQVAKKPFFIELAGAALSILGLISWASFHPVPH
jgi:hypothetical protein